MSEQEPLWMPLSDERAPHIPKTILNLDGIGSHAAHQVLHWRLANAQPPVIPHSTKPTAPGGSAPRQALPYEELWHEMPGVWDFSAISQLGFL